MTTSAPGVETLVDLLARAIAEVDDGNISAAAKRIGVSRPTVYGWLRGVQPRKNRHLQALADYVGTDVATVQQASYASGEAYSLPVDLGGYLVPAAA